MEPALYTQRKYLLTKRTTAGTASRRIGGRKKKPILTIPLSCHTILQLITSYFCPFHRWIWGQGSVRQVHDRCSIQLRFRYTRKFHSESWKRIPTNGPWFHWTGFLKECEVYDNVSAAMAQSHVETEVRHVTYTNLYQTVTNTNFIRFNNYNARQKMPAVCPWATQCPRKCLWVVLISLKHSQF